MENPTYRELQRYASHRLTLAGCESVHFTTMNLMTHCFQLERADLILKKEERPPLELVEAFKSLVERCAGGEPLQYILGEWEFMGLPFAVGPGVLIPRPETELLVDTALRLLRRMKNKKHPVIYDLCTGSGAVAVSMGAYWKDACVYALELSPRALSFAKENIRKNGAGTVQLKQWDVLAGPQGAGLPEADLILSNPPYICSGELPSLQREVQREPAMALDGGEDGLKFYRAVKELWLPALSPSGALVLECGAQQGRALAALFEGRFARSGVEKDISGLDRIYWGIQSQEPGETEPF